VHALLDEIEGGTLHGRVINLAVGTESLWLRGWMKGPLNVMREGTITVAAANKHFACDRCSRLDVATTYGLDHDVPWGFTANLRLSELPNRRCELTAVARAPGNRSVKAKIGNLQFPQRHP
jgi:hypothetical protein